MPAIELRGGQRLLGGLGADRSGEDAAIPETAFANAGHQFETTGRKMKPLVNRSEPRFDLGRRDDVRRQTVGEGLDANVVVAHTGERDYGLGPSSSGAGSGARPARAAPSVRQSFADRSRGVRRGPADGSRNSNRRELRMYRRPFQNEIALVLCQFDGHVFVHDFRRPLRGKIEIPDEPFAIMTNPANSMLRARRRLLNHIARK